MLDGSPTGIESPAQTWDGYLWMATSSGLFRFDGVRFERIEGVGNNRLLSNNIFALRASPEAGGLWLGYRSGGASFLNHMKSILPKLDDADRTHAVMIALKRGILDL